MWDQKNFEKRAIFPNQLSCNPINPSNPRYYLADHIIIDAVTGEHRLKDLGFTFLQLPEFLKKEEELVTLEEKWVYFLSATCKGAHMNVTHELM